MNQIVITEVSEKVIIPPGAVTGVESLLITNEYRILRSKDFKDLESFQQTF